jgi:hypothetical protein
MASFLRRICPPSGERNERAENTSATKRGTLGSRNCKCSEGKAVGVTALATGVVMVIMSAVIASGVMGGGQMYFVAAGLAAGSILPFSLAAYKLKCEEPPYRTMGSVEKLREQEQIED